MLYLIIFLLLVCLGLLIYILLIKRNITSISKQIQYIIEHDTNAQINQLIHEKNTSALIIKINTLIEKTRLTTIASHQFDMDIKQTITNVTHDLRTPLTVANGYLQLLKNPELTKKESETYLNNVELNLERLTEQVQTLFDYAKIQEHKIKVNYTKLDIGQLLLETLFPYYDEFLAKAIDVDIDIEEDIIYFGDTELLTRVFQNLIGNILSYGENSASFSLHKNAETIEIIIKNETPSTELDIEKVFSRFYTEDLSRSNQSTGLGLAIVKEFITLHNGTSTAAIIDNFFVITLSLDLPNRVG